jgi:hypothetical protein
MEGTSVLKAVDHFEKEIPRILDPLPHTCSPFDDTVSDFESEANDEGYHDDSATAFQAHYESDNIQVSDSGRLGSCTSSNQTLQADFETALKPIDFDGEFAVSARYADAPNPCLEMDGLGTVGLPLSDRDGPAVIAVCDPVRAGSGIWRMSPEKVAGKTIHRTHR